MSTLATLLGLLQGNGLDPKSGLDPNNVLNAVAGLEKLPVQERIAQLTQGTALNKANIASDVALERARIGQETARINSRTKIKTQQLRSLAPALRARLEKRQEELAQRAIAAEIRATVEEINKVKAENPFSPVIQSKVAKVFSLDPIAGANVLAQQFSDIKSIVKNELTNRQQVVPGAGVASYPITSEVEKDASARRITEKMFGLKENDVLNIASKAAEGEDISSAKSSINLSPNRKSLEERIVEENQARQNIRRQSVMDKRIRQIRKLEPSFTKTAARALAEESGGGLRGIRKGIRSARVRRLGIKGGLAAGGLALAGLVAKNIFSEDEGPKLDPATQLALAQQLGGGQGGVGNTSRTLIDMSRLLGLIKTLQGLQGVGQAPPSSLTVG